jgi:hypothetical protein
MRSRPGELPTAADHPRSIFTLLGRSHRLHVEEPITDVCPDALCGGHRPGRLDRLRLLQHDLRIVEAHLLLPEGLRGGLPAIDRGWEGFGLEDTTKPSSGVTVTEQREQLQRQTLERLGQTDTPAAFARIGDSIQPGGGKPGFYFIHAELPHAPWRFLPDGHAYTIHRNSIPGLVNEVWTGPRAVVDQAFQRHLLQTQYADRLVGELLDRLRSAQLYDRALVVVTADHGVSFRTGQGRRGPSKDNMPDIANVPLIIKAPRQHAGRVDDGAVRTIDILPTISELLGEPLKWDVDGIPADRRGENADTPIDVSREFDGGVTTVPFGRVVAMRDARERREERLLGRSPESVYRIGSDRRLLGRRLATLDVLPAGDARVSLDGAADYARVAPDTGVVPAYVSGAVSGLSQGDEVAIAVDGRVRATTQIRREGSENVFAALVPPASLTAGSHAVVVLQVLGAARLRQLPQGGG